MRWLLLTLLCTGVLAAQSPDAQAKRILEQPAYRGYRIERPQPTQYDGQWQGDGGGDTRSGLDPDASEADSRQDGRFRRGSESERRRTARRSRGGSGGDSGDDAGTPPDLSWIGSVLQVLVWIVVGVAAAVGLFFLVKAILGIRFDRRKAAKRKVEKQKKRAAAADAPLPEAAPETAAAEIEDALQAALRQYHQAVEQQQWDRAVLLGYRIFWLRAGWQGCVEDADVRTWRDAVRMVRAAEMRQQVREALRLVEVVRYGDHATGREEFTAWQGQLDALNPAEALR